MISSQDGKDGLGEASAVGRQEFVVGGVEATLPDLEVLGGQLDEVDGLSKQGIVFRLCLQVG